MHVLGFLDSSFSRCDEPMLYNVEENTSKHKSNAEVKVFLKASVNLSFEIGMFSK